MTPFLPAGVTEQDVRLQVDRMAASNGFVRSERLRRFLGFLLDHSLAGDTDSIQEYVIGLKVFDRRESFDPSGDSIVRVEARRLRKRLAEYYEGEGRNDAVVIGLPAGGYLPTVQLRQPALGSGKHHPAAKWLLMAGLLAIAGLALAYVVNRTGSRPVSFGGSKSIAVLPFANHSKDAAEDYFADGLMDFLVADLTQIRALRVISRTTMMRYRGVHKAVPEIGKELGLDYVVEGGVLRSGDRVRVTVQLIHAPTDHHVWARTYEEEAGRVLDVQRAMVKDIIGQVAVTLSSEEVVRAETPPTASPRAYEALLKGVFAWNKWTGTGAEMAVGYFRSAVEVDPRFALGWAWLAAGHRQSVWMGDRPSKKTLAEAKTAALRAVELQPGLGTARHSLGLCLAMDWQWKEAEKELLEAIRIEPGNALFHHGYGILLLAPLGRLREAEAEVRQAVRTDPVSLTNKVVLGKLMYFSGRHKEGERELREVLSLDPNYADGWRNLGAVLIGKGLHEEGIAALGRAQQLAPLTWGDGLLAYAEALSGDREGATRRLSGLIEEAHAGRAAPMAIATAYSGLGARKEAVEWLQRAIEEHDVRVSLLDVDPIYAPLRSHPGYAGLLRRLALPQR